MVRLTAHRIGINAINENEMKQFRRHITILTGILLMLLALCVSCSSQDEAQETVSKLNIHIYGPGDMNSTRADAEGVGTPIDPLKEEQQVNFLQLWVYNNADSYLLGSLELSGTDLDNLNNNKEDTYSIDLPSAFANRGNPVVDVYILANVKAKNCGVEKGPLSSLEALEDLTIDPSYFRPSVAVPAEGLPMSGVLRNQNLIQKNDVFHLNDAKIQLERAVSKIRFVFSSLKGEKDIYIDKITLDQQVLNEREYMFLTDAPYHVGNEYTESIELYKDGSLSPSAVVQCEDPTAYAFKSSMDVSDYVKMIEEDVEVGKNLTKLPLLYLRESDKKLKGKIHFHLYDGNEKKEITAPFSMVSGDFRRNQTWIVYAYYIGSTKVNVSTVQVTDWQEGEPLEGQETHNW